MLEIVFRRFLYFYPTVARRVVKIYRHFFFAEDVLRGQRIGFQELIVRSIEHQVSTEVSGSWSDLYDPIGCFDELFVMFYNNDGVSHLSQFFYGGNRSEYLSVIESDSRFVQHVNYSC